MTVHGITANTKRLTLPELHLLWPLQHCSRGLSERPPQQQRQNSKAKWGLGREIIGIGPQYHLSIGIAGENIFWICHVIIV